MNLRTLVWRELWERPSAMATSAIAILLGDAALVAIQHVTHFSEKEIAQQLEKLGANILILPKSASLQDYYAADLNGQTLPEEHVSEVMLAGLTGVEKLSPKLCVSAELQGKPVTLTGILPQSEFRAKSTWQTATLFNSKKHMGCKKAAVGSSESSPPESLASQRTIETLLDHDAVVGSEVAEQFGLKPGATVELMGESFNVLAVLAPTGTVDDSRLFAHLHTVQKMAKAGEVVSAIEVLGCCEDAAGQLVPQLANLLPNSKVVTISQVVQTQVGVNRLMASASKLVLIVLTLVGGASVLSTISSNVRERRREIGTLMALGATPNLVSRIFLLKATWLGLLGGIGGTMIGVALAVWAGPRWAGVQVVPLVGVGGLACAAALLVTLTAAYWPARQAARLDPCTCFQEV